MNNIIIILTILSIFFYNTSLFISFNAMLPFILIVLLILIYIFDNNRFSTELYYTNNVEKINTNLLIDSFEKNNFLFASKKINSTTKLSNNLQTYSNISKTFKTVLKHTKSEVFIKEILKIIFTECYPKCWNADIILKSEEAKSIYITNVVRYIIFKEFTKEESIALLYALEGDKEVLVTEKTIFRDLDVYPPSKQYISTSAKLAVSMPSTVPDNMYLIFTIDTFTIPLKSASKAFWDLTFEQNKQQLLAELVNELEDSKKKYFYIKTNPKDLLYFPWNDLTYKRDAVIKDDLHEWSEDRIWGPKFLDYCIYQFFSASNIEFRKQGVDILKEYFPNWEDDKIQYMFRRPPCLFDWDTGIYILTDTQRELVFQYMKSKKLQFPNISIKELINMWENEEDIYFRNLLTTPEFKQLYDYV